MKAKRILVIDDEEDILRLVSRILRESGYEVDMETRGHEAVARIRATPPDLVVLDLLMPEIDGWGVLDQITQLANPPQVLILSAHSDYETLQRAAREGAAAIVAKPFRFDELIATCHRLLSHDRSRPAPQGVPARRVPRTVLGAEVTVLSKEGSPFFRGELRDLSPAGAKIQLDVPLDPGDIVRLASRNQGSDTNVSVVGRVQWRSSALHGFSHGLAFERLLPEEKLRDLLGQGDN